MIEFSLYEVSYGRHKVLVEDPDILKELVMQILSRTSEVTIRKEE